MTEFHLPTLRCGHCAARVTQALRRLDPDCQLDFDLPQHRMRVQSRQPREHLAQALREAGYAPATTAA